METLIEFQKIKSKTIRNGYSITFFERTKISNAAHKNILQKISFYIKTFYHLRSTEY